MRSISKVLIAGLLLTGLSFAGDRGKWRRSDRDNYRSYDRGYSRDYRNYNDYGFRGNAYNRSRNYRDYRPDRYRNLPPGLQKKLWRNNYYRRQQQNRWYGW
jgi:hypothetical protein